mgnify:CR=1 FL=1
MGEADGVIILRVEQLGGLGVSPIALCRVCETLAMGNGSALPQPGGNFALYYAAITGRPGAFLRSAEAKTYALLMEALDEDGII